MSNKPIEPNPFLDEKVALEWINSIENESKMIRDNELYPVLEKWAKEVSPKLLVDIGAGQGICADHVQFGETYYVGIEPSEFLVKRASEKYKQENREFIVGDAYKLPLQDKVVDAALSVNVWFHLKDLALASRELSRVLASGGKFLISTANPKAYDIWRKMYFDAQEDDEKIDGKVNVPVNPLSRNIFYKHTRDSILNAIKENGLQVDKEEDIGFLEFKDSLFVNYFGHKL